MARTALTPVECPAKWAILPTKITWTAADNVNGNSVAFTGKEILLVRNDNVGAQVVTVTSAPDKYGRTGNQTHTIPASEYWIFGSPFPAEGWVQADTTLYIDGAAADVFFCVLKTK